MGRVRPSGESNSLHLVVKIETTENRRISYVRLGFWPLPSKAGAAGINWGGGKNF